MLATHLPRHHTHTHTHAPARTPTHTQPEDWVDAKKIEDPEEAKPEGYDDIPAQIEDPEAEMPDDWDEEDDGEWEPPMISNPDFKGEWKPTMIDNPDYKGPWEVRRRKETRRDETRRASQHAQRPQTATAPYRAVHPIHASPFTPPSPILTAPRRPLTLPFASPSTRWSRTRITRRTRTSSSGARTAP